MKLGYLKSILQSRSSLLPSYCTRSTTTTGSREKINLFQTKTAFHKMVTGFRTLVIFMETSRNQIHILVVFMAISCNRVSHPLMIFMETFFANILVFFVGFVRFTMQMPTKRGQLEWSRGYLDFICTVKRGSNKHACNENSTVKKYIPGLLETFKIQPLWWPLTLIEKKN